MFYYSTNHQTQPTSFREAVIAGLAPDKGLFMPESIPPLPEQFFQKLPHLSLPQIGQAVIRPFVGNEVAYEILSEILTDALNFEIPLVTLDAQTSVLELFHGPTCAFKDVGARVMARLMAHFLQEVETRVIVLVATSGDTGSAVAQGFYRVPGVDVVILYPSGKVSAVQEKQFATLGENITALEITGTFDDCQQLVKQAFADAELRRELYLTSANSINLARLLPQAIYYFYAYAQLRKKTDQPVVFSVPSGNYGNLTAGLFAQRMGLPVHRFIAASNANDSVPQYLTNGLFQPKPSVDTISNAMDVGNPSNFARMGVLYDNSVESMRENITGYSFTNEETSQTMREVYGKFGYLLDPHGAVAYRAFDQYRKQNGTGVHGIILETAHPAKFGETVTSATSIQPPIPPQLAAHLHLTKQSIPMEANFKQLKEYLLNK